MPGKLTYEYLINGWLVKHHGITVKELVKKEPELVKRSEWFLHYPVTQQQHDEWYDWAVSKLGKNLRMSKIQVKRYFQMDYLNVSPAIKKDDK